MLTSRIRYQPWFVPGSLPSSSGRAFFGGLNCCYNLNCLVGQILNGCIFLIYCLLRRIWNGCIMYINELLLSKTDMEQMYNVYL